MLSFLFGSRGLRPDLPSPFGRKFLFCLLGVAVRVWDGRKIFAIYALSLLMYTVASPDPDPNPRGGVNYLTPRVQFHANECNERRDANPQPQERNFTLTSGTSWGAAPTHTIYTRGGGQLPYPKSAILR